MQSSIISVDDYARWAAAMARVGARDVYFSSQYHKLYSFLGGRCLAYIATRDEGTLFYPFFIRPVQRIGSIDVSPELHDIETVYGYTGPMATAGSSDFLAEAWGHFEVWCSEHKVVSEFIRFNPFLRTERFAARHTEVSLDRRVVEICLSYDEDDLWRSYESVQRNRVRKALQSKIICHEMHLKEGLPVFRRLYEATMRRIGASGFYLFPDTYYEEMLENCTDKLVLFVARLEDNIVAASLFLRYEENLHYYLGASAPEYLSLAPNNLLFHEVAIWAQRRGFKRLHMGGGRSNEMNDSLLRFKRRFSRNLLPFYIGRRVHDVAEYQRICELWLLQSRAPALPSYFPPYRLDLSPTPSE